MASDTATTRTRRSVKRLSAQEKREKISAGADDAILSAGSMLLKAAEGFMARKDRTRTRLALDLLDRVNAFEDAAVNMDGVTADT